MFTANEMLKALQANEETRNDFENLRECAKFAEFLETYCGCYWRDATETLEDLLTSHTLHEGDTVRVYYRELTLFRAIKNI